MCDRINYRLDTVHINSLSCFAIIQLPIRKDAATVTVPAALQVLRLVNELTIHWQPHRHFRLSSVVRESAHAATFVCVCGSVVYQL